MTFPVCMVGIPYPLTEAGRLEFSNGRAKLRRAAGQGYAPGGQRI